MMKNRKRITLLSLALLLGLLISGCSGADRVPEGEIHHRSEYFDGDNSLTVKERLALLEERLRPSSGNLFRYVYAEEELLEDLSPARDLTNNIQDFRWETPAILGTYPVDNVRFVDTPDGGHYYAVWMTDRGNACYVFFNREGNAYGHPVYAAGTAKSRRDFSSLKEGDKIEKVIRIDPATKLYAASFRPLGEGEGAEEANRDVKERYEIYATWSLTSVHLLRDGFLEIRYRFAPKGGYEIDRIACSADFKGICSISEMAREWDGLSEEELADYEEFASHYDFTILEKDYCPFETDDPVSGAERNIPVPVEETDWTLKVAWGTGERAKEKTLRRADIGPDRIVTVVAARYRGNDPEGSVQNMWMGGVFLTTLAESEGAGDWDRAVVTLADGTEKTVTRHRAEKDKILIAWIRNEKYALDGTGTGLALASRDGGPDAYRPGVAGVRFLPGGETP